MMDDDSAPELTRMDRLARALRRAFGGAWAAGSRAAAAALPRPGVLRPLVACTAVAAAAWLAVKHLPVQTVPRGEVALRDNRLTGRATEFAPGSVLVVPGLHELRVYDLRDHVYRPEQSARADGPSPFQSVEGLSLGVDLSVRYALDPRRVAQTSRELPQDVGAEIVAPAVQGVIYRVFTHYTVREIFSSRRVEIQQALESELRTRLAADGVLLRSVQVGKVDLPADYKRGMESLLAEELASEKMRYTLELKDKQVKESELVAEAEKVRREKAAEAAGSEQVIAARAQEEAMKHVLPFKQKQIEQRQLEADADKVARIRTAEGTAQARRIEAAGEADSRQKLADAEAYRLERVGRIASEQMARDGALLSRHPLLIQKTMADKLSDKVQVIIAPPPADGGFIGSALLGGAQAMHASAVAQAPADDAAGTTTSADAGNSNGAAQ